MLKQFFLQCMNELALTLLFAIRLGFHVQNSLKKCGSIAQLHKTDLDINSCGHFLSWIAEGGPCLVAV